MTASFVDDLILLVVGLGHWAYLIIFLGAMLESAAFLGLFVPGETLVLLGGFLVTQGTLELGYLMLLVSVAAIIGDTIGYELGRRLGRPWLLHYGRWLGVRERHLERADRFFQDHGGKTVLIGRFIGILRAMAPFVAGTSGMRYRVFLFYNVLGAVLWSVSFSLLGYLLGVSWRAAEKWIGRAGAIAGGAIVLLLLLWWLWRWLGRHEEAVKRRWRKLRSHPTLAAAGRRLAPLFRFVEARFRPRGALGLYLTVGALLIVGGSWLFGAIARSIYISGFLNELDREALLWVRDHTSPPLTELMRALTALGAPPVVGGLGVLVALVVVLRRCWYRLLELLLVVPGGLLLCSTLKLVFQRPRPPVPERLVEAAGYSFPSSHAMGAVLIYGLLAVFLVQDLPRWRPKVSVVLSAFFLILAVGFSRLYLGAVYLTDVLGGFVLGVAWLALCTTSVEVMRRHSPQQALPPARSQSDETLRRARGHAGQ